MTQWFRSWHGAPTDPKWILIARKADSTPLVVSAVMWALLDHASQHEVRGTVADFDHETYAAWSGADQDEVVAIITALSDKQVIVNGRLANWEKRQPKREDDSRERVKAYRARVTAPTADDETYGNADVTQCNASETQCNAPEKNRADTETEQTQKRPEAEEKPLPTTDARKSRATDVVPSEDAIETAGTLINAPWVNDEFEAVARAVERSFQLVPDFRTRDGPVEGEKYGRARAYRRKPPDDWYRAWLNWIKKEARDEQHPPNRSHENGRAPVPSRSIGADYDAVAGLTAGRQTDGETGE